MIAPFALSIHICAPQKLLSCAAMLSCRSFEMLLIPFLFPQGYINSTAAKTNEENLPEFTIVLESVHQLGSVLALKIVK